MAIYVRKQGSDVRYKVAGLGGSGAASGVASFNGRTGAVLPAEHDYNAGQVDFTPPDGMSSENVQEAVEELFTSVGEGKALIASAITDKGVDTAADASFGTMRANILAIETGGLPDDVYSITLTADPPEGGTVEGGGYASAGMTCNALAVPDTENDYAFGGWKENDKIFSIENKYSFLINSSRSLVASFFVPVYFAGIDWWVSESGLPFSNAWYSIAYGDRKFVAAANNAQQFAFSEDGETWMGSEILPYYGSWGSVSYGNDKFVSIAYNSNKAIYSENGMDWSASSLPSTANWSVVTFGNGKFVVLAANSNKAAYSEDGVTWTATTLPSSAVWRNATYGNGRFVAISEGSNKAAYSEDGVTWTASTLPSSASWYSITFGNGTFVTVANNSNRSAWSKDGITWNLSTMPSTKYWQSVAYGDWKFVAVSIQPSTSVYSTDGIEWIEETNLPTNLNLRCVAYGMDRFVATTSGKDVVYSYNGDKPPFSKNEPPA